MGSGVSYACVQVPTQLTHLPCDFGHVTSISSLVNWEK